MKHLKYLLIALGLLIASQAEAANRFAVCTTTCTWDTSSTAMWSTTTGGGTGASVPGAADTAIFDGATCVGGTTCTITAAATLTNVAQITFGACTASTTGCILDFSVNNPNLSMGIFSITGTGTRQLKLGSGTFTLTNGSGVTPLDIGTSTNLTLTAGTSTIAISVTSTNFNSIALGGQTLNRLTITDAGNSCFLWTSANGSIGTLVLNAPSRLCFNASGLSVTTAFTSDGTSSSQNLITANTSTSPKSITVPSGTIMTWTAIASTTFSTNTPTCNNCFNLGGVTNATINAPSTGGGGGHIIGG